MKKSIIEYAMIFCWTVLIIFFVSIVVRFLTRQILIEQLNWDNAFTHFVFADNQAMNEAAVKEEEGEELIDINWQKEYSFADLSDETIMESNASAFDKLKRVVFSYEENIKYYTTDLLIGQYPLTEAAQWYNKMIGSDAMQTHTSDVSDEIIYLKNGYLAYKEELVSESEIDEIADNVEDFAAYLDNRDIDFVYMNAGSKICPYDTQLPAGVSEYSNENGTNLIRALEVRGVNTLDFRDYMIRDNLDWYKSYYITDHHWKTTTSLWAAGIMAQYLNENMGFNFDGKYFDTAQYDIETYSDYFLGVLGRKVTLSNCSLESYDKVLPKFDTSFSLYIPMRGVNIQGTYQEALFDQEHFDNIAWYSEQDFVKEKDTYHSIQLRNDAYGEIHNLNPENNVGKKILMIYDSFSWYTASYLATDVSEIDTLYLCFFDGSVRKLVDDLNPDAVIMVYCERNIQPIVNPETHTDLFDLR